MALIKCPECSHEISDSAKKCPNCGYKLRKTKKEPKKIKDSNISQKKSKTSKIILITVSSIVIVSLVIYLATINRRKYKSAIEYYNSGNYDKASVIFEELDSYEDSKNKLTECKYQQALALYNDKNYENAKTVFTELGNYKDSNTLLDECNYQLSVDAQFLEDLKRGLIARWDYSDTQDTENMDTSEFKSQREQIINCELDIISKYLDLEFTDSKLKDYATQYINALKMQLEALPYYNVNNDKYVKLWKEGYNNRATLIGFFINEYHFSVDEDHMNMLNEFKDTALVIAENEAIKSEVETLISRINPVLLEDSYGYKTYGFTVENITSVEFEYFEIQVKLYDSDNVLIDKTYVDSLSNWAPGDKAQLSFMTNTDFEYAEYNASWTVK